MPPSVGPRPQGKIAIKKGLMTETECDDFIREAISLNHARFPVSTMKDYAPDRDLSWWY